MDNFPNITGRAPGLRENLNVTAKSMFLGEPMEFTPMLSKAERMVAAQNLLFSPRNSTSMFEPCSTSKSTIAARFCD